MDKNLSLVLSVFVFVTAIVLVDAKTYNPRCEECVYGKCKNDDGICVCNPCFTGAACSTREQPEFTAPEYNVIIAKEGQFTIRNVKVTTRPECGNATYFIHRGNADSCFKIDDETQDIISVCTTDRQRRQLNIRARYEFGATATAIVNIEPEQQKTEKLQSLPKTAVAKNDRSKTTNRKHKHSKTKEHDQAKSSRGKRSVHHIVKRQITGSGLPSDVTLLLSSPLSEVRIGEVVNMQLVIWLPNIETDIMVELYAPRSNDTDDVPLIVLENVNIIIPDTNFADYKASNTPYIRYLTTGDNKKADMISINFGTVNNQAVQSSTDTESKIVVEFEAIIESHSSFGNGVPLVVTAGVVYNAYSSIWIGSSSLTGVIASLESSDNPSFSLSGPSTAAVATPTSWSLNMTLRDATNKLVVDVYSTVNNSGLVSVCAVSVQSLGKHYDHFKDEWSTTVQIGSDESAKSFDMGYVTNTGFWSTDPSTDADDTITLTITVMVLSTTVPSNDTHYFGVSVLIDDDEIWSEQMEYTIVPKNLLPLNDAPTYITSLAITETAVASYTALYANLTLPMGTVQDYRLEFAMPINASTIMSIFSINVTHIGSNYQCLQMSDPVLTSESGVTDEYDYGVIDLGTVYNSGVKDTTAASTIQVKVVIKVMDKPEISIGDSYWVSSAVYYDNIIMVAQDAVTIVAETNATSDPTFTLKNKMYTNYFYEDSSFVLYLETFIPVRHQFSLFTIDINSAIDNATSTVYTKICRVEKIKHGKNIVTPVLTTTSESTLVPKSETYNDRVIVNLSSVSNLGLESYDELRDDNILVFEIVVSTAGDSLATSNGTEFWTDSAVTYGNKVWVGQYAMTYTSLMSDLDDWSDAIDDPRFGVTDGYSLTALPGQAVVIEVQSVVPPTTTATWKFVAVSETDELSMCQVQITKQGRNIPCISEYATPMYSSFADDGQNDLAELTVKGLSNIGTDKLSAENLAENTLYTRYVIGLNPNLNLTAYPSDFGFNGSISIEAGENRVVVGNYNITVDSSTPLTPGLPLVNFYSKSPKLVKGGAIVMNLDIWSVPTSYYLYILKIFAPVNATDYGKLKICDVRIMSAGYNVPCLNDTILVKEYTDSVDQNGTMYDGASITFRIANVGTNVSDVQTDDNKVSAEVVVCALDNSPGNPGDFLYTSGLVQIAEDNIYVATVKTELTDIIQDPITATVAMYSASLNDSSIRVGECKSYYINLTFTEGTDYLTMGLDLKPYSDGPSLMLKEFNFVVIGENLAADSEFVSEDYTYFQDSMARVSGTVTLGMITNTGTTQRYTFKTYQKQDDVMQLEIVACAEDNFRHLHATTLSLDLTTTGSNSSMTTAFGLDLVATGNEKADIYQDVWFETDDRETSDIIPGEQLRMCVHFNHSESSSAHAFNVEVKCLIPAHAEYDASTLLTNGTEPTVVVEPGVGVTFQYGHVRFADNNSVCFNFTLDYQTSIPVGSLHQTAMVLTYINYMELERNQTNVTVNTPPTVNFVTDTTIITKEFYVPEDVSELGLCTGLIDSCQVSASNALSPSSLLTDICTTGWSTSSRLPPFYQKDYVQIYFANVVRFTGYTIMANSDTLSIVTKMRIRYSDDGRIWHDVNNPGANSGYKIFDLEITHNDTTFPVNVTDKFFIPMALSAFKARYVRLIPLENSNGDFVMTMRLELHGVTLTSDYTGTSDICASAPSVTSLHSSERCFLATEIYDGEIYACVKPSVEASATYCSRSLDMGSTWQGMDRRLGLIHFFNNNTGIMFGKNEKGDMFLSSSDGGDVWYVISEVEYQAAQADAVDQVQCLDVPFTLAETNSTLLFDSYYITLPRSGVNVGASNVGLYVLPEGDRLSAQDPVVAQWGT